MTPIDEACPWQWQEPGTAWRGVGLYHITLTIPCRTPLLGTLIIPDNDPSKAWVERTELGGVLLEALRHLPDFHPEIQVLHYCLMPDHLHAVWYVRRPMPKGISSVAQGFWRVAKKIGRAYNWLAALSPSDRRDNPQESLPLIASAAGQECAHGSICKAPQTLSSIASAAGQECAHGSICNAPQTLSSIASAASRENPLRNLLGDEAYYRIPAIFTEMPFIRPMGQRRQLPATIRYIDMNPQRLATKRLMPGFFRVQKGIVIAGRTYSGVGNIAILQAERYATVHVRHELLDTAAQGNTQPLRNYMNGCVLAARQGTVMVSPFISPKEKDILDVLLTENHPFILLADNDFRDYYKPSDLLFDSCASGRALILSPWPYDANKRHITRADCVALNAMAEEIADGREKG